MKLIRIIFVLLLLTVVGTAWFSFIEGWSFIDSLYMTVITLSTVGFREIQPPSDASKVFIVLFLTTGIGIFMYGIVELGETVVRAELRQWWRKRNMNLELKALRGHFIVCGFGRMGRMVCEHLAHNQIPFVAIERDQECLEECEALGYRAVEGDATEDRTLKEAGLERARGLAAVLSSDADNLYVVLSAKLISKNVRVIARSYDERGSEKLQRAGADQVVSLYASGATKMAQLLTNPHLGDFFEVVSEGGFKIDLAEIQVGEQDEVVGKRLSETRFRDEGVIIVGILRDDGTVIMPPTGSTPIYARDNLFAMGDSAAIERLANR